VSLAFGDGQACAGGSDPSPLHFTGKMRDVESGLDEFPARYYSSVQGRWLSPDWSATPVAIPYALLDHPQTLNLYDYVGDDPTNHPDADGHVFLAEQSSQGATTQAKGGQPEDAVTVVVEQVKSDNPFGHVAIGINGETPVGLVPDSNSDAGKAATKEAINAAKGTPAPSTVPGHVENLAADRKAKATATIHVTKEQATAMRAAISEMRTHPQQYDPGYRNCTTFVEEVLRAGGINAPPDTTPGGLVTDLKQQYPQ
jgi:RHS repeat-associated protein